MTAVLPRKGIARIFHVLYIVQLFLSFQYATGVSPTEPPEPEKELSEKRADNNPRPTNKIPQIGRTARATRFPFITGLTFFCWVLHELRTLLAASAPPISVRQPLSAINVYLSIVSLHFNPGHKAHIGV
jgi:hypothetical protein